jgi:hypothetical protein
VRAVYVYRLLHERCGRYGRAAYQRLLPKLHAKVIPG